VLGAPLKLCFWITVSCVSEKNSPPTQWNLNIHHCANMTSHVNVFEFPTALLHSASFNTKHLHFRDHLDMLRNRKKLVSHKWWQGHLNFDIFCLRKNCHRSEYACALCIVMANLSLSGFPFLQPFLIECAMGTSGFLWKKCWLIRPSSVPHSWCVTLL